MRQTLLMALFCGCAAAQYYPGAGAGSSTTPCSATVTTNCAAQVSGSGNYVPPIPGAGVFIYYLQDTASAVATYKQLLPTPYTPKTTESYTPANGTHVIQNYITQAGVPGLTFIPAGQFEFHIHASRAGGPFAVYAEFWETNASGADINIIGTTEQTAVDTTETEYRLFFINRNPYVMATSASRVVCRVWAVTSSSATARLYVGDTSDSHIAFPSSTVDVTNFVPYSGATADLDLGTHSLKVASCVGCGGGAHGTAVFSTDTGAITGLTVTGCITGASYITTGHFSVSLSGCPANYSISLTMGDDTDIGVVNLNPIASYLATGFSIAAYELGLARFFNPHFVFVTIP